MVPAGVARRKTKKTMKIMCMLAILTGLMIGACLDAPMPDADLGKSSAELRGGECWDSGGTPCNCGTPACDGDPPVGGGGGGWGGGGGSGGGYSETCTLLDWQTCETQGQLGHRQRFWCCGTQSGVLQGCWITDDTYCSLEGNP